MIKTLAEIRITINERIYTFMCENDSPFGDAYEASKQVTGIILQKMNELQEQQTKKKDENETPSP